MDAEKVYKYYKKIGGKWNKKTFTTNLYIFDKEIGPAIAGDKLDVKYLTIGYYNAIFGFKEYENLFKAVDRFYPVS